MAAHGLTYRLSRIYASATRTSKPATLVLLFVLLSAAVVGVAVTLKGPDWAALWQSLLFGLLLGWTLALLRERTWRAACVILILGLIYILLIPGSLIREIIFVAGESIRLTSHIASYVKGGSIDFTPLLHAVQSLYFAIVVVFGRIGTWATGLATGQPIFDPVAATLVWNALIWDHRGSPERFSGHPAGHFPKRGDACLCPADLLCVVSNAWMCPVDSGAGGAGPPSG